MTSTTTAQLNHLSNHGTVSAAGNKTIFGEMAEGQKYAFEYDYLGDMRIVYCPHNFPEAEALNWFYFFRLLTTFC